MVFCNIKDCEYRLKRNYVTILILIDGFLQYNIASALMDIYDSHNPYFNRWFSAMREKMAYNKKEWMSQSLF